MICKKLLINNSDDSELLNINFEFNRSLAIIGQSGSGKSLTLKAIMALLPKQLKYEIDIDFRIILGKNTAFVPQNPFTSLSSMTKIRDQFFMDIEKARENLSLVGLDSSFLDRFPAELSGGQLQRVIIAMALTDEIELLLLDEPTTALDSKNRDKIINLIKQLQQRLNFKLIFVTHDIESIRGLCESIVVIKDGKVIESGGDDILLEPKTNYLKSLLEANFKNRKFRE
jgi:peptide/nickel transport system ATP-binding protein